MPEWIGKTIGRVRVEKYLAGGGMAEVYLGTHLTLDRPVAVKVLHSYIESNPDLQGRFEREAKAVAGLRHANIVQIFDFDTYEGHPYIVMEYLKGPALSTYLHALHDQGIKLPLNQIGHLLGTLATSLDYAHSQGVIHRDIKPANILLHSKNGEVTIDTPLTNDVEPIITDFGLARLAHSVTQTESGLVSGTPAYMSPEQARGTKVDHRTDIYSLGVILYELIAGRVPFEGESTITVILKHINETPPVIEDVSPELQSIIDKALAKDPEDRYQNGRDLAVAFYDAVGMHAEAKTIHALQFSKPRTVSVAKKQKPSRNPLWIGAGLLLCICVAVFGVSTLGLSAWFLSPKLNIAGNPTSIIPVTSPTQMPAMADSSVGTLRFQDGAALADQVTISATLDALPEGKQYEAWLVDDSGEKSRSIGVLEKDESGTYSLTFVDPQSRNLLADFSHMEITIEPNPDNNPNPSEDVAYSSGIPGRALAHIRHLIVSTDETPNTIGMIDGLKNNTTLLNQAAEDMLNAYEAGNKKEMRSNAEAVINLIVGNQDSSYLDWDGNGKVNDPGDGYGLLVNGDQTGYVGGVHHHASYSADADDSTPAIRMHDGHVEISIHNIEEWAVELRDITERIVKAPNDANIEADVRTATALANQILNGLDTNGNEIIEPIPGEGGALNAYQHAYYMSDIPILVGKNQMPATGK
ncbi:MAG: protein kinase [Anaerolineales bacterium]